MIWLRMLWCTKKNYLLTIFDIVVIKEISNIYWELQKIPSCFTRPERIEKNNVVTVVYIEIMCKSHGHRCS